VSTLEDLNAGPGGMVGLVSSLSRRFRPVTRRSLLVGAAVAGSALATKPKEYALRPVAAYATICGPVDGGLLHRQHGRQRLPAGLIRRRVVEGSGLVVVRRRVPLHRRLQRVVLEVQQWLQRRHLRLQVLELFVRVGLEGHL
jgi:hypothetical protein